MSTDETALPYTGDDQDRNQEVADILVSKYGRLAASVAARQHADAVGDQKAVWSAIAALLPPDAPDD